MQNANGEGSEHGAEAEDHYDYVIIGTGLAETALSCILAKAGKYKILHLDRNASYGDEFATFQYTQLLQHFGEEANGSDKEFIAHNREFNVDLTPKLLLQDSPMKDFLLENEIQELVSFTSIKGSFLHTKSLHSIPASETQALRSSVVSFMQKPRVVRFFWNVRNFMNSKGASVKNTMREEFARFSLSKDSIDFIGHAIALNLNDDYLEQDPRLTYDRIVRYIASIVCYEETESPYIYPLYGLSELCQAFARRSALLGTIFMLKADIHNITGKTILLTDPSGNRHRITAGKIIADPKHIETSRVAKEIIRCIMILKKDGTVSRNIVFLKSHLNRQNDIFCVVLGREEMACPVGYEVAILSTVKETDNPEEEIAAVVKKFDVIKKFVEVRRLLTNDSTDDIIYTCGVDESAHMDSIYADVQRILSVLNA